MFGIFDFKDTLHDLFLEVGGLSWADIGVLRGTKVGVDGLQFIQQFISYTFQEDVFVSVFSDYIRSYHEKMRASGVSFVVVSSGGFYSNEIRSLELNHAVNRIYWKCYVYQELHRRLENPKLRQARAEEDNAVLQMMYVDGVAHGSIARYYELYRPNMFNELGLDFIRAPKHAENQLLWMYQQGSISAIVSTPLAFLFPGIEQVVDEFDFAQSRFRFFDFQKVSDALGLTPSRLRLALLLYLVNVLERIDKGEKMKMVRAIRDTHASIPKCYVNERAKNVKAAKEFFESFREKTAGLESEEEWTAAGIEILGISKKSLERVRSELFKAQVITERADLVSFPSKRPLTAKKFCFGVNMKDLLVLYCMELFPDSLLFLLGDNFDNTWFYPVTFVYSLQSLLMRILYFREIIERSLFRVLSLRGSQEPGKYSFVPSHDLNFKVHLRTDYFYPAEYPDLVPDAFGVLGANPSTSDTPAKLAPEEVRRISFADFAAAELLMPSVAKSEVCLTPRQSLELFVQEIDGGQKPVPVPDSYVFSVSEISGLVNCLVLEDYGHLDLRQNSVTNLGRMILESVSPEFFEPCIIALELARIDMFEMKQEDKLLAKLQSLSRENQERVSGKSTQSGGTGDAQRQKMSSKASFQEFLQHTIKINILESQVSIIDHEITEFLAAGDRFPDDKASFVRIGEAVRDRRRQIDFISKFFMLSVPNIKARGLADYESTHFFEKLHVAMRGLDTALKSILTRVFLRTGGRTPLSTLTKAFRRIPYIRLSSNEMAMLSKKVMTNLLIFQGLKDAGLRFAKEYGRQVHPAAIEKSFGLPAGFALVVCKAFRFFGEFERVSQSLGPWTEDSPGSRFRRNFRESRPLFEEIHKYFVAFVPP